MPERAPGSDSNPALGPAQEQCSPGETRFAGADLPHIVFGDDKVPDVYVIPGRDPDMDYAVPNNTKEQEHAAIAHRMARVLSSFPDGTARYKVLEFEMQKRYGYPPDAISDALVYGTERYGLFANDGGGTIRRLPERPVDT